MKLKSSLKHIGPLVVLCCITFTFLSLLIETRKTYNTSNSTIINSTQKNSTASDNGSEVNYDSEAVNSRIKFKAPEKKTAVDTNITVDNERKISTVDDPSINSSQAVPIPKADTKSTITVVPIN